MAPPRKPRRGVLRDPHDLAQLAASPPFLRGIDHASLSRVDVTPTRIAAQGDAGQWVIRSDDFLALGLSLVNLDVVAAGREQPATLRPQAGKTGYIVLGFPPQSIAEKAFYATRTVGIPNQDAHKDAPVPTPEPGAEDPQPPPIESRIADRSRAVFRYDAKLLADAGMATVPYTLQGILDACLHLPLSITANAARAAQQVIVIGPLSGVLLQRQRAAFAKLSAGERARTLVSALGNLRVVKNGGAAGMQLLLRRAELRADAPSLGTGGESPVQNVAAMAMVGAVGAAGLQVVKSPASWRRYPPGPTAPTATQTALELPYRLIVSPNETGRFVHAGAAQAFAPTGCTPLWHTRLGCLNEQTGQVADGPGSGTEVRAVWARLGPLSDPATFNANWPHPDTSPTPDTKPFRMTLDDRDRFNIVHESSNFRIPDGYQEPIECKRLMLSALGGWLDLRGAWEVPAGLSVEEWVHQATQARDHYVRVIYKGYLCPFGHRVSLVKVSERKFQHGKPGNAAYLRQRTFMIVREPVRMYPTMGRATSQALPGVPDSGYSRYFHRQFPFSQVRCLTHVTPDLQDPAGTAIAGHNTEMFWPCVLPGQPFAFKFVATDLDGKDTAFELPGIFIDNALANPAEDSDRSKAEPYFLQVQQAWFSATAAWRTAATRRQSVCMAPSKKAGDTACELDQIEFGAEVDQLRLDSATRAGPLVYPSVWKAQAFIPALTYLTGGNAPSPIQWNRQYAARKQDFDAGEVFLDVAGGPNLDFTSHGDRSGGFVQPNLAPSGLSRLVGPVAGDIAAFNSGNFNGPSFFSAVNPLLFGCIPLGDLLDAFGFDASKLDKLPKFVAEAMDAAQTFFGALGQASDLLGQLEDTAKQAAKAALDQAIKLAFAEIKPQIQALDAATAALTSKLDQVLTAGEQLATIFDTVALPDLFKPPASALTGALGDVKTALGDLLSAVNLRITQLPGSGLSDAVQNVVQQQLVPIRTRIAQVQALVADIERIPDLVGPAKDLLAAVAVFLVPPDQLQALLKNEADLQAKIQAVGDALTAFQTAFDKINLFAGSVRGTVDRLATTLRAITTKAADVAELLAALLGDELTVRFDWHPTIKAWPQPSDPVFGGLGTLFQPHDPDAFVVGVEAKIKKSTGEAKINVLCGLRAFDLILLGENFACMKLVFEKIEFRADSAAKMDVDVKFDGIHFLGPLKFVETLKDLIPLDGFSDPPALSVTEKGIDASFSMALPNLAIGVLNCSNLSLGAGFTVPFIAQPLAVRFNFCTRDQPFCLTVAMFGGGGFFGITIDPHGVQLMEAAFEFGAAIAVDFGVASGGVHVMAGIYFRMEHDECQLSGYFRMGGNVSVLGIVSVSIELYLALTYDSATGKAKGEATLTISVSVFLFSVSASIHCERTFAGANGDPSFAALMGPDIGPVTDDSLYPWRDYVSAFA